MTAHKITTKYSATMKTSKFSAFFAASLLAASLVRCDYGSAEYEEFEGSQGAAACEVGLTSFKTNISAGLAGCSCHQGSQAPRLTVNADVDNRKALLKTQRDYSYLSGSHQGANAVKAGISETQWNTWQADEKKCP